MRKFFTLLFIFISAISFSQSTTVVISQVYAGGGVSNGYYKYDYVELHNVSIVTQSLSNYSLQYGASTENIGSNPLLIFAFPLGTSIPAGGYLLIQTGPPALGSTVVDLPITPDFITSSLSMSPASGKVALISQVAGINCGASGTFCTVPNANLFVDVVVYGVLGIPASQNLAEGGVSVNNNIALTATQGAYRKQNGCQDTDNNNNDFLVVTNPVPRNASTPAVICGGVLPSVFATPNYFSLLTNFGIASNNQIFNLTVSNLIPASDNLIITPSLGLEISFNNISFFSTAQNLAYTNGAIPNTAIYIRISASATQGLLNGAMTISGGALASNVIVNVTGGVIQNYYTKPTGFLSNVNTWGTVAADGTGSTPITFLGDYQIFNVKNRVDSYLGAPWEVSGMGSKLIISSSKVYTTDIDTIKASTKVDIGFGSALTIANKIPPTFGNLNSNSQVTYSYIGTDTVRIAAANYGNLKLSGGLKYFKAGITTVNGNLDFDNVTNCNGSATPFSTISLRGNLNMTGNSNFEDSTTGSDSRITLNLIGAGSPSTPIEQLISTNNNELKLFGLSRDTLAGSGSCNIRLMNTSKITLGNNLGGGLKLLQKAVAPTSKTILNIEPFSQLAIVKNAVVTDATNNRVGNIYSFFGNIIINKSLGNTTAGTLRFEPNSSLNELTINITTPTKDSIVINDDLGILTKLNLLRGKIVMSAGKTFSILDPNISLNFGVTGASFIDGLCSNSSNYGGGAFMDFPIGKGTKFAPVSIYDTVAGSFTAQYFNNGFGNYTINPVTLNTFPTYNVSKKEFWQINKINGGTPNIELYYFGTNSVNANPTNIRGAHFNSNTNDWDDKGSNYTSNNNVDSGVVVLLGVTNFSPFTLSATVAGVLPIKLNDFTAIKNSKNVDLQFVTRQEVNTKYFEVQKSIDAVKWNTIATLNAAGSTTVENKYNAIDFTPSDGINYYRIKTIDVTGEVSYTIIKTVLFSNTFNVAISPNPVKNILNILIAKENNKIAFVSITNAAGAKVYEGNTQNNNVQLNLANYAKGSYFVKVVQGQNVIIKYITLQ